MERFAFKKVAGDEKQGRVRKTEEIGKWKKWQRMNVMFIIHIILLLHLEIKST
jgi:hypothetical protein